MFRLNFTTFTHFLLQSESSLNNKKTMYEHAELTVDLQHCDGMSQRTEKYRFISKTNNELNVCRHPTAAG